MDHHCPWVSNCIGAYNQKYFFLYLFYTGLSCVISMCYNAIGMIFYFTRKKEVLETNSLKFCYFAQIWSMMGVIVAAFFGLMILDPFLNVIYNGIDNQTTIESEKDNYGVELDIWKSFSNIFGEDSMLFWMIPITPTLHVNYMELLYPYNHPKRKKPEEEPQYYPRPIQIRGKYEMSIFVALLAICIYGIRITSISPELTA